MGRDIQSNIQYNMDNDPDTENSLTPVLVFCKIWLLTLVYSRLQFVIQSLSSLLQLDKQEYCSKKQSSSHASAACSSWHSGLIDLVAAPIAGLLNLSAKRLFIKKLSLLNHKILKVQELRMEWPNRRQMIHSHQKWMFESNSSRVFSHLMHDDDAYIKMLELFVVKLIWHQGEFIIWYRLYHFGINWTWTDIDVQALVLKNWRYKNLFLDRTLWFILFCPRFSW